MNFTLLRRLGALAGVAALAAASIAPAGAQVDVDVAVDNVGGSRTLYVEDLAGNSLTSLDFGNARSLPFRVRVVDSTMDRTGFTVSGSMTNLYHDTGGGVLDWSTKIDSADLSLGLPGNPLNVLDPQVVVQPIFDTVSTITDGAICTLLSLPVVGGACTINASDVQGLLQTVDLPVDLADLSGMPLLPQTSETGAFTSPSYGGVASGDPAAVGAPAATSKQLVAGTAVADATVLSNVQTELDTLLGTLGIDGQIDSAVLTSALRDAVGVLWDLLSAAQVTTVINSTVATVQALTGVDLLAQLGTYLSFPLLNVTVPDGLPGGTFRGTLVVTGLE